MKCLSDFYLSKENKIYIDEINNRVLFNNKEIDDDFYYPRGVDFYKGKIVISDSYNHIIKIFDISGKKTDEFGKEYLIEPYGVKCFEDKIYCCNKDKDIITVFDFFGNFIKNIDIDLKKPSHIDIYEGTIYISDLSGIIKYYDTKNEKSGELKYQFSMSRGLKSTKNFIFAADEFDKSVVKLNKDGIYIKKILKNGYFSLLSINSDENTLTAYDEKNGEFKEINIDDVYIDIEEFLRSKNRIQELFYYYIERDEFEKAKSIFNIEIVDKKEKECNLKFYQQNKSKSVGKFIDKHYPIEAGFLKRIGTVKQINDIIFKNPKSLFVKEDNIYVGLFNYKLLVELDYEHNVKQAYGFEMLIDKIAINNGGLYAIDYFYRIVYFYSDIKSDKYEIIGENYLENPVDILIYKNKSHILDSIKNKIYVFNMSNKKVKDFDIEGTELIALDRYSKGFISLDKYLHKINIYNEYFELQNEIRLKDTSYPDDLCVDENDNIFLSDEMNSRILKIDIDGNLIYEISDFERPRDIFYNNGILYVNDFGDACLKYYEVRK